MRTPALLLLAALLAIPVMADIAPEPLPASGLQPPGRQEDVEMAAEEVALVLTPGDLKVEATFHMRNAGKADVRIQVGFPMGAYQDSLKDFSASRDGKPFDLSVVDRNAGAPEATDAPRGGRHRRRPDWWVVWDAVYPAGKTVTETVRYRTENKRIPPGYILNTGAGWAGKIGKAVVTLTLADGLTPGHLRKLEPAGFSLAKKEDGPFAVWSFQDLEPTLKNDIHIDYNLKQTLEEECRDLSADGRVLRLGWARSLGTVDASEYWASVKALLDSLIPKGLPKDEPLTLQYRNATCEMLEGNSLFFNLLHEAAADPAQAGVLQALPGLRELALAWQEGRIRVDYRAWKRTRRNVFKSPDPDEEALRLPSGVDPKRLQEDLQAAKAILEGLEQKKGEEDAGDPNGKPNGRSCPPPNGTPLDQGGGN